MDEMAEKGCIQIIAYIKRKPTLTLEQFYDHWQNKHAPIIAPWAQKHNLRRYQQARDPILSSIYNSSIYLTL
jgi:hypothetical protein